jgi:TolB protein
MLLLVVGLLTFIRNNGQSSAAWLSFITTYNNRQTISLTNPEGKSLRQIALPFSDEVTLTAWLPDGQWLISTARNETYYLTLDGGLSKQEAAPTSTNYSGPYLQSPRTNNLLRPERMFIASITENGATVRDSRIIFNKWPSWSPNGKWLIYASNGAGGYDIYRSQGDGTATHRLTDEYGEDITPSWSPDGQWITFSSTRSGGQDIYRMRADGSNLQRLTDIPGTHTYPKWSDLIDTKWNSIALTLLGLAMVIAGADHIILNKALRANFAKI